MDENVTIEGVLLTLKDRLLQEQTVLEKNQLKHIDFSQKVFEANGKIYYIEQNVALARWGKCLKYEVELGMGQTFQNILKQSNKGYEACNEGRLADAAVGYHNIIHMCINGLEERVPAAFRLCCIFINTAGEDRTILTDQMINEKITDWSAEGIAVGDFFDFALNTIPGYISAYKTISLGTSEQQSTKQEKSQPSNQEKNPD